MPAKPNGNDLEWSSTHSVIRNKTHPTTERYIVQLPIQMCRDMKLGKGSKVTFRWKQNGKVATVTVEKGGSKS